MRPAIAMLSLLRRQNRARTNTFAALRQLWHSRVVKTVPAESLWSLPPQRRRENFTALDTDSLAPAFSDHTALVGDDKAWQQILVWRGLPPTGRPVRFPLCGIFTFDEENRLAGEKILFGSNPAASWKKRRASDLRSRRSTSSRPRIKTKREPKQVLARYHLTSPPRDSSPRYTYRCAGIPKVAARDCVR
jgi:hypothetical protein